MNIAAINANFWKLIEKAYCDQCNFIRERRGVERIADS